MGAFLVKEKLVVGIFNPELARVSVSVFTGVQVSGQEKPKGIWYEP